ncbi:hypothetical protein Tco_0475470 [Tanacetum coccineum]
MPVRSSTCSQLVYSALSNVRDLLLVPVSDSLTRLPVCPSARCIEAPHAYAIHYHLVPASTDYNAHYICSLVKTLCSPEHQHHNILTAARDAQCSSSDHHTSSVTVL